MKVYKFGGASISDAEGIRNLKDIVCRDGNDLIVVISAMGKTTNALEKVVESLMQGDKALAKERLDAILMTHVATAEELGLSTEAMEHVLEKGLRDLGNEEAGYDEQYDQVVSMGELLSTALVYEYLIEQGVDAAWVDMTETLITNDRFREAQPDIVLSERMLRMRMASATHRVTIVQGFIGGMPDGRRTTLGREGSDYTAALVANMLNADSVTIWKDVPGILNADPRLVENTILIPELSYLEAVELAYSGAQVIHPKTIRPLENKNIPLYVKPYFNPDAKGSVICDTQKKIDVPVYIWRRHQTLITIRPKDFSFVLEQSLSKIFDVIDRNRLKVSLIQSSAVTISVSVDATRYVPAALAELSEAFKVTYNEDLSLLTIRGTTPDILTREQKNRVVLLKQQTRRTARLLVKDIIQNNTN